MVATKKHTQVALVVLAVLLSSQGSLAQDSIADKFGRLVGGLARRNALLGVLQSTQDIRVPASAQSLAWDYDAQLAAFVPSPQLGPTVFLSTSTLRAGTVSLRSSAAYFELSGAPPAADYTVPGTDLTGRASYDWAARIGVLDFTVSYGLTNDLELTVDIPVAIVDYDGKTSIENETGELNRRSETTDVGLGQVAISAKYRIPVSPAFSLAAGLDVLLPSPNEKELAGAESFGVVPRVIARYKAADWFSVHGDVGYTYQEEFQELSGATWNVGASIAPAPYASFDFGLGGAVFERGVRTVLPATRDEDLGESIIPIAPQRRLGDTYVNLLLGVKYALSTKLVLTASLVTPLNSQGIRPDTAGSIGIEYYL